MKRVFTAGAALILAGVFAGAPQFGAAQSAAPWFSFHGNSSRNGVTTVAGPTEKGATAQWDLPQATDSSPAVGSNGVAYIGDNDGKVYALDPASPGVPKWAFKTGGRVVSSPTLSGDGKTLYVGSEDNNVYAIDTSSGKQIWATTLGGPVHASPTLTNDGSTLWVPNINGQLFSLSTSNGAKMFEKGIYVPTVPGSVALSPDGNTLYVATTNGYMYAIPATGAQAGRTVTTQYYLDGPAVSTPAVDTLGNIYVSTSNGSLMSFVGGTATPRWIFKIPTSYAARSTAAIANGLVIFGAGDQNVYGLNASNGQISWQAHTGGAVASSPAISSNNLTYVGSDDGNIYAFTTAGQLVWQRSTGAAVRSSPAIGPDGTVWVASETGRVYRIGGLGRPPSAPPANSTPTLPTQTPGGTITPLVVSLKPIVKPGAKQVIKITTLPRTIVRIRINYPNGDHQSHTSKAGPKGIATYKYKQGGSKIKHNRFLTTVLVRGPSSNVPVTATYTIGFGRIDASAEPRSGSVGKTVNIYVHAKVGKRVSASLSFTNGRVRSLGGHKTGRRGFAHWKFKIYKSTPRGKVRVFARLQGGGSTQTNFTVR